MTFTEVVEAVTRHTCKYYFRPVHWRGGGVAYTIEDGAFHFLPYKNDPVLLPGRPVIEDFGYEWEMVDVATIRAEKGLK